MIMTDEEKLAAYADNVVRDLGEISGIDGFGYNAESVRWVDGFIERQRVRTDHTDEDRTKLETVLSSYLGACVIACFGGKWERREGQWAIFFDERNGAFPFSKVHKQFANGAEDSIYSWFTIIPSVFGRS